MRLFEIISAHNGARSNGVAVGMGVGVGVYVEVGMGLSVGIVFVVSNGLISSTGSLGWFTGSDETVSWTCASMTGVEVGEGYTDIATQRQMHTAIIPTIAAMRI